MNDKIRSTTKKYLLVVSLIVLFLGILVFLTLFIQKQYDLNMMKITQNVITKEYPNYTISEKMHIDSPISYSSMFFKLNNNEATQQENYAVIIRITGLCGPQPVVFICIEGKTEYVGIAGIDTNKDYRIFDYGITESMIKYYSIFITEKLMEVE